MARPGFDALTLRAVAHELQIYVGGRLQGVRQPEEFQIVFEVYRTGVGEARWLFDCSPQWARTHLTKTRVPNAPSPPAFCAALRKFVESGTILSIAQRGSDRILDIEIRGYEGHQYLFTAEFMGRHSNLILLGPEEDGQRVILHAAKLIPARLSRVREVLPGRVYIPPPALRENGFALSPFLKEEVALRGDDSIEQAAHGNQWQPVLLRDESNQPAGAYPLPLKSWTGAQEPRPSLSVALDEYYSSAVPHATLDAEKRTLTGVLNKAWEQRAQALAQIEHGQSEGSRAAQMRRQGELILGNLWQLQGGQGSAIVTDYFQDPPVDVTIALDADLTPQENAARLFDRARNGEKNASRLEELQRKMSEEIAAIENAQEQLQKAASLEEMALLREQVSQRGWLQTQQVSGGKSALRPDFGGKKIRSYTSPEGWQVFVGDNAEANDYLVQRLGQSNDWWLHLRAGTSAHALVKTNNAPLKVPKSTLEFAARLVVQRSAAKHAGVVAVDYTLKKYVRKPRRAAPGSVLYSHEKTLHVGVDAVA
jgi:predicted ribosome quality control (RQC) complex YloA/Tae2 family protein